MSYQSNEIVLMLSQLVFLDVFHLKRVNYTRFLGPIFVTSVTKHAKANCHNKTMT